MKAYYVREQKHICGKDYKTAPYMEVDLFEVTPAQHKSSRRAKRELATSLAMQNYNNGRAIRYFVQLAATNFGDNDYALTLTYNDRHQPAPDEQNRVDRDLSNYIKRLRRWCKKHALPCPKWLAVTEYRETDQDGTVTGRHHHHLIIQGTVSRDVLEDLWRDAKGEKIGITRCERIELDHGSFEGLTRYMTKRKRCVRRWRQSRGLEKPKTPPPNDSRWSRKKLDEAATLYIDDRAYWEAKYPGYTPNSCERMITGNQTQHMVIKLRNISVDGQHKHRRGAAGKGG